MQMLLSFLAWNVDRLLTVKSYNLLSWEEIYKVLEIKKFGFFLITLASFSFQQSINFNIGPLNLRYTIVIPTNNLSAEYMFFHFQAFCAALQFELTEYYRLLSVLQSQLQQNDTGEVTGMTLAKLNVWTSEPMQRLKWIAVLVENCKGRSTDTVYYFVVHWCEK